MGSGGLCRYTIRAPRRVRATYNDQIRNVLVAGSDDRAVTEYQPEVRLNVFTSVLDGSNRQSGCSGVGGRLGLEFFSSDMSPEGWRK